MIRFIARIVIAISLLVGFSACNSPTNLLPIPPVSPTSEHIVKPPYPTSQSERTSTITPTDKPTELAVEPTALSPRATPLASPIKWIPEISESSVTSQSPDGFWTAEMIYSEERLLLQVIRKDGSLTWLIIDKKGPLSIDDPIPSQFRWSTNGRYMYYYSEASWQYHHPASNGCDIGGINVHPQRLNLETGEISPLAPELWDELEEFSISPNATAFAYFDPRLDNTLTLHSLETGEKRSLQIDIPRGKKWAVGEIVWSPDDSALAFSVQIDPCNPSGIYPTSIIVVDVKTGIAQTVISNDPELDWQFEWLEPQFLLLHDKNGTPRRFDVKSGAAVVEEQMPTLSPSEGHSLGWLTFIAEPEGYPAVYAIRADGYGLTRLSGNLSALFEDLITNQVHFGDWSPDGSWIAFTGSLQASENDQDIFIARTDGTGRLNLTNSRAFDSQPDWSPDGQQIVFSSQPPVFNSQVDLYVIAIPKTSDKGENPVIRMTDTPTFENDPVWSPDGSLIAFTSSRLDNIGEDLFIVSSNGSGLQRLTNNPVGMTDLDWSPDGERIAFLSGYEGDAEVYVINSDGTGLAQVTKSVAAVNSSPTWSPNGAYIAYLSMRNEKTGIYIARVDGTGEWLVVEIPAWAHSLYWGLLPGLSEP